MKKFIVFGSLSFIGLFLSSCGIPHGDSIEDCRTMSQCYYDSESVRTEGSDMSSDLVPLILNEEDNIMFYYDRNPGGEFIAFIYVSSVVMTKESLDEIIDVLVQIEDIVGIHYDSIEVETLVEFGNIELNIYFDDSDNVRYISTRDKTTNTNVDDYTEEDIFQAMEENADKVVLILDYTDSSYIRWFGIGKINIVTENGTRQVHISNEIDSQAIRNKIEEILEGYEFTYPNY